jgi:hypothetical protein
VTGARDAPCTLETVGANDHSSAVEEQHTPAGRPQRAQDIFISLLEVKKENWSFGNGVAQYA